MLSLSASSFYLFLISQDVFLDNPKTTYQYSLGYREKTLNIYICEMILKLDWNATHEYSLTFTQNVRILQN